jgi:hypothetical protein
MIEDTVYSDPPLTPELAADLAQPYVEQYGAKLGLRILRGPQGIRYRRVSDDGRAYDIVSPFKVLDMLSTFFDNYRPKDHVQ